MSGLGECFALSCVSVIYSSFEGYKLREKIGKALCLCAEAIRRALEEYNKCAAALHPPRDPILCTKIVDTVFLAELDILKDTRQDIRKLKWAYPTHCKATHLFFDILRAREEVQCLNVKIRRLLTSMYDEHIDFVRAINATWENPPLSDELRYRLLRRDRLNSMVVSKLAETSRLKGFSGSLLMGKRVGRPDDVRLNFPLPSWACLVNQPSNSNHVILPGSTEDSDGDSDEEGQLDEESEQIEQLTSFVSSMDLCFASDT